MSVKAILILCAQALLVKSALSQCTSRAAVADAAYSGPYGMAAPAGAYDGLAYPGAGCAGSRLAYDGLAGGYAGRALAYDAAFAPAMEFTATSGGALPVSSASAIAPVGISVISDNAYEGALSVIGELPFVGTVGMEGVVPSDGAGAVNHACGNGRNAMISETSAFAPAGYGYGASIAPASALGIGAPFGYRAGLGELAYPTGYAASGLGYRGGCGCGL